MAGQHIGARIKALRQERGLSQDSMASLFGFRDRQTVSAIETGVRRVTATELLLAVEKLNVPLDYFTDPFRLNGEGLFSWRQRGVGRSELAEYERVCEPVGRRVSGDERSSRSAAAANAADARTD